MSDNNNHEHIGDGVYAEVDGYAINIRVGDHRSPILVVLEPAVMNRLNEFYKRKIEEKFGE